MSQKLRNYMILRNPSKAMGSRLSKPRRDLEHVLSSFMKEDWKKSTFPTRVALVGGQGQGKSLLAESVLEATEGAIVASVRCSMFTSRTRCLFRVAEALRDAMYKADGGHTSLSCALNIIRDCASSSKWAVENQKLAARTLGEGAESIREKLLEYDLEIPITADTIQRWIQDVLYLLTQQGRKVIILLDDFEQVDFEGQKSLVRLADRIPICVVTTTQESAVWALGSDDYDLIQVDPASPDDLIELIGLAEPDVQVQEALLSGEVGDEVRWLSTVCGDPRTFLSFVRENVQSMNTANRRDYVVGDVTKYHAPLDEADLVRLAGAFKESASMSRAELSKIFDEYVLKYAIRTCALRLDDTRHEVYHLDNSMLVLLAVTG